MLNYKTMTAKEAIRTAKEESGLTAEQIAQRLGVSISLIRRYLKEDDNYNKNCLHLKMWKESLASTKKLSHTDGKKASARYIQILAGTSSMNAPFWKNILHPGASKLRNQNDDFLRLPACPL